MLETSGAPFELGHAQGRARASEIAALTASLRRQYGWTSWRVTLSEIRLGGGRCMQRFTPQMHERLEGIAAGAGVNVHALELFELSARVAGVGTATDEGIEARLDLPAELAALWLLRRSRPDAGGFPTVELTCAPWSGCLAGVNACGLGAVVLEDRALDVPSLRVLAQDVIWRAQDLAAGVEHLRLRASCTRPEGVMHMAMRGQGAVRVELGDGRISTRELPVSRAPIAQSTVRLDLANCSLEWQGPDGEARQLDCKQD